MQQASAHLRVVVLSDEDIVYTGLCTLLDTIPGVECVPAPDDLHLSGIDVVLVDLTEAVLDTNVLDRLVSVADPAIVAITHDLRPDLADRALARGIDGCISLGASGEELRAMLQSVAWGDLAGERDPDAVDYTENPAPDDDATAAPDLEAGLSPREDEVLRLIGTGLSNQQIAEELFLSINSVKTHIRNVYRKIKVTSRSQAVIWIVQRTIPLQPSTAANQEVHTSG